MTTTTVQPTAAQLDQLEALMADDAVAEHLSRKLLGSAYFQERDGEAAAAALRSFADSLEVRAAEPGLHVSYQAGLLDAASFAKNAAQRARVTGDAR